MVSGARGCTHARTAVESWHEIVVGKPGAVVDMVHEKLELEHFPISMHHSLRV